MKKTINFSVILLLTLFIIIALNIPILSNSDIWYVAQNQPDSSNGSITLDKDGINIIISFLGVAGTFVFGVSTYLSSKKSKKMSYKLLCKTPLLSLNGDVLDEVKIFFKDELVTRVSLITMRIFNNGELPIKAEDFASENPGIKILFKAKNYQFKVLSTEIFNRSNLDINPNIKIQDKEIIINSCLWNIDDFIEIQALVNNYGIEDEITVTAHIDGMKGDLTDISESTKPLEILLSAKEIITLLLASLSYLLLTVFALRNFWEKINDFFYIPLRLLLVSYVLWLLVYLVNFIVLLFNQQYRKQFSSFLFIKTRQQND